MLQHYIKHVEEDKHRFIEEAIRTLPVGNIIYRGLCECTASGECSGLEVIHYAASTH